MRKRAEIERDAAETAEADPRELLAKHEARPIRAFLERPGDAEAAFWDLLYGGSEISHETATRVASELESSAVTVGRFLAGWRPASLKTEDTPT